MSRPRGLARLALLIGFGLMAVAPAAAHQAGPGARPADPALSPTPALPVIRAAPDFALRDTAGAPVRLADLRGRVVLVSFIFTRCTWACPLLTAQLARLQARLLREAAGRVQLLSVTVDPARDSAEALAAYARRFRARWWFLREEPAALGPMLAAYDEWTRPAPGGDIEHPARLHLIDGRGRVREIYSLGFFDERQAWLDIRALLQEE